MTSAADASHKSFIRIQGILLAVRSLLMAAIGIFAYNFNMPIFIIGLLIIAIVAVWLIKKNLLCRLPYCFLFTSAIWAGVSMALVIVDRDPIAVAFGLSLAIIDGSFFATTWRRSWL